MTKQTTTRQRRSKAAQPRTSPIRLVQIPNAADADGEPRVALEMPPVPGALSRRPVLLMFVSMAAALATKRSLEARS